MVLESRQLYGNFVTSESTNEKEKSVEESDEIEIVTAASTQVDDGDDTGPFSPPDENDMLKFEAKDAIDKPPIEDEKDVSDTGTDM